MHPQRERRRKMLVIKHACTQSRFQYFQRVKAKHIGFSNWTLNFNKNLNRKINTAPLKFSKMCAYTLDWQMGNYILYSEEDHRIRLRAPEQALKSLDVILFSQPNGRPSNLKCGQSPLIDLNCMTWDYFETITNYARLYHRLARFKFVVYH